MAQSTPKDSRLIIVQQTGTDSKGAAKLHNLTFAKVNPNAADQDVFDVGTALGNLQSMPVYAIERQNTVILSASPTA